MSQIKVKNKKIAPPLLHVFARLQPEAHEFLGLCPMSWPSHQQAPWRQIWIINNNYSWLD